jgi:LysM repeat protein
MERYRSALLVTGVGLLTFVLVLSLLEFTSSRAAPAEDVTPPMTPTPETLVARDSLASDIEPGHVAIGVPLGDSAPMMRELQPGDRLDVVASLPSPSNGQPVTGVVVHGAIVLRPPTSSDPLLLQVPGPDAMALSHLILGGTHLGYIVWPSGIGPATGEPQPLDEKSARALLGVAATAVPVAVPTIQPGPDSGFLYQVQQGDTWDSIARLFGKPTAKIRQWNEATGEVDPTPGRLIFIPRA